VDYEHDLLLKLNMQKLNRKHNIMNKNVDQNGIVDEK